LSVCLLEREDELKPDETALGEVLLSMDKDTEFFISVGSGSVTDITRYVAFNTGRPFVSIGTAPSMDGYTSVVAPLLFNGTKVNKPASYPPVIICDLEIMKSAPLAMFISGVGDVLGKYIARADWRLGNIVNNESYCPMCADFVIEAVQKCIDNIDEIKNRSEKGTRVLIEALIMAGVTIMIIGNTRATVRLVRSGATYARRGSRKLPRTRRPGSPPAPRL
jgi:glycerol-1-phosphate dehydrogenase [NAD(P)+]